MNQTLSLDEYIRQRKMGDQFALLNLRRRDKNIDQNVLDRSLDDYIRQSGVDMNTQKSTKSTGSKFDRIRDSGSEDEDEDFQFHSKTLDSDVEMVETKNENEDSGHGADEADDELGDLLNFQTAESRQGVRVRSQQWRMLPENLVDRPAGVKRLECLPLEENERFKKRGVHNGRVNRGYRSRNTSISGMSAASSVSDISAQGRFIEKGPFTFKIGVRNGDGQEGLIGIERQKRFLRNPNQKPVAAAQNAALPQVNINMNWEGFAEAMGKFNQVREPIQTHDPIVAAARLLDLLEAKRQKSAQSLTYQKEISQLQGKPLLVQDHYGFERIVSFDGEGVDVDAKPHTTQQSLNSRFA